MRKLLIVGAGQLGSRHLQGALVAQESLYIVVVDPAQESLIIADERSKQVKWGNKNSRIRYSTKLPESENFDVCIIATAAQVRADVTKALLITNNNSVKHIIFEKVLFQKVEHYSEIQALLQECKAQGWVNCPRRIFPTYQELKHHLDTSQPIRMTVTGNAWGMACNSVHFIDLFSYLVDRADLDVIKVAFDSEIIESKRIGFYEITGEIEFAIGNNTLRIESGKTLIPSLQVTIENGHIHHIINEVQGTWLYNNGAVSTQHSYTPLFQSQLTGANISELLVSNQCQLTPFAESCSLHTPFIKVVLEHLSKTLNVHLNACPIT
ncbi:Gfo/Idh/MocA family oxidoreductase [Grimontia hollisae]|uniref:Oxidoreductase family, NAD-binding Rossmann fold n=1 Tax=Grimontia hollisae TaxID=673 RepID=A0A377HMF3_GRIHO|nr:Gfo/Idh/MocA family oxidoreductase [Grimontia hollisae]MDF2183721.1 Gfo/Idh/MocA family oxidoreductase [Grimontia hollisae]STO56882.1 Oxidoreductase family, NAD-binding Rossmann fold [Grimontia hollisae]STQ74737.1 Oxidoreductase family, NAD-binding Rossmann fold [Grimontia hollisae]